MRWLRVHVVLVGVVGFLAAAALAYGLGLSLSAGRRHARQDVAFLARYLPRAQGYRLGRCRPRAARRVVCAYTVTVRALPHGTITCTSEITVARRSGTANWTATFPRRGPRCVRRPALKAPKR